MAARATGHAHAAPVTPRPVTGGRAVAGAQIPSAATRSARSTWLRRATITGRICVWAIPVLAVLAVLGLRTTDAFATNPGAYARFLATKWSSPMAIALTTATGVFALISIIGLTLLLLVGRGRWIAVAGAVPGVAGAVMMLAGVGSVVVQKQGAATPVLDGRFSDFVVTAQSKGSAAAWLVVGGAVLLTIGWILLGLAVMRTAGLNRGDGALLAISAPLVYLGGFVLHLLPALGAFLLGAAGLGIVFTSGRVATEAQAPTGPALRRPPVAMPSAFARFTDEDRDARSAAPAAMDVDIDDADNVAGLVRSHSAPSTHGGQTVAADHADDAPTTRRRGLGRFSRGVPTAWQVNRAKPAEPNASEPDGSEPVASEPIGATGSDRVDGKFPINGRSTVTWTGPISANSTPKDGSFNGAAARNGVPVNSTAVNNAPGAGQTVNGHKAGNAKTPSGTKPSGTSKGRRNGKGGSDQSDNGRGAASARE